MSGRYVYFRPGDAPSMESRKSLADGSRRVRHRFLQFSASRHARTWISAKFLAYVAGALLAILPIVNPLGAVPLVMTVAAHLSEQERLRQIRRACVYTFVMMAGFLLAGGPDHELLRHLVPGMRIAGGMIVASLGFQMLFPSAPLPSRSSAGNRYKTDIAFTPLAMPGLAGRAPLP